MTNDVAGVAPPEPGANPELAAEQRHVDRAYAQLDRMRHAAEQVARGFDDVSRGGTHQARLERDVAAAHTRRRLAALELGDAPLCFGRLDMLADATDPADPGPFHVGRLSVTDDELSPLVVDWRAPVAEPFYRATAIEPMGVGRRRHFQTRGRRILGIDDEVFDAAVSEASGLTVVGEAALLSALRRERTGRMHDIVATIQAEQDEAIRAPITGVLVVSGGPGTGKTAVALHRAAYLLYTHRRRLASQGVLLVGPSAMFLRYIDEVLPSLGEDEVVLATARALKPRLRVTGVDATDVAALKGSARMASVIARAVRDRERPMPREVVVVLDGFRLRMRRRDSAQIVGRAHARRGTHNSRRPFVVSAVLEHFRRDYRRRLVDAYRADQRRLEGGRDAGAGGSHRVPAFDVQIGALLARGEPAPPEWNEELTRRLRRAPEIVAALERMWPVLTGAALVHDLLGFEGLIRSAAADALSADEQRTLFRPRVVDVATVPWTEADLALIDEADALLGPPSASRPRRGRARRSAAELEQARRTVEELGVSAFTTAEEMLDRYAGSAPARSDDDGETRTFGHVLVDEAQDLSAMQWRMLARRCPSGSMTLVGDFAQATKPGALPGWDDVLAQLPERVRTARRHALGELPHAEGDHGLREPAAPGGGARHRASSRGARRRRRPAGGDSRDGRGGRGGGRRGPRSLAPWGHRGGVGPGRTARPAGRGAARSGGGRRRRRCDRCPDRDLGSGRLEGPRVRPRRGRRARRPRHARCGRIATPVRRADARHTRPRGRAFVRPPRGARAGAPDGRAARRVVGASGVGRGRCRSQVHLGWVAMTLLDADRTAADVAWDLEPLVDGRGAPGVDALLDDAESRAGALAGFRGRIAALDATELAELMEQLAVIGDLVGRAGSYAGLRYSVDTADPELGALMARTEERSTAISNELLFVDLEWAAVDDEQAAALLEDAALAFCRHHLEAVRRYRPYLLSEPEERILAEKSLTATNAWVRLFSDLTSAITVELDGATASLEEGLSRLASPDRDARATAAGAVTEALAPGLRTRAFIFNTLLADKSVDDRLRNYSSWIAARNLGNEASDESVQALVDAVQARYDIPQRWYALKARLLGVDRLADYDRMATVATADEEFGWNDAAPTRARRVRVLLARARPDR